MINDKEEKYYMIRVDEETKQILDKIGRKGESYNKLIRRLMLALKEHEDGKQFIEGLTLGLVKAEDLQ
jgi:hypothetical protein